MGTTEKQPLSPKLILLLLSLALFAAGSFLSFQDEQERFLEMGALSQTHLVYALQLKDDMAVIDWSKALEKLPSVVVFQAKGPAGLSAQGGNQTLFPLSSPLGLSFRFPYQWIFRSTVPTNSSTLDFTIVFQDLRGPLFWGLCWFFSAWVIGFILSRFKAKSVPEHWEPKPDVIQNPIPSEPTKPLPMVDPASAVLTLDKHYMIFQATPLAAQALGRELSQLLDHHFLDLLPDPAVMKSIDEGHETRLLKPFPSQPHISALLKPTENGTLLFLESEDGQKGPK